MRKYDKAMMKERQCGEQEGHAGAPSTLGPPTTVDAEELGECSDVVHASAV